MNMETETTTTTNTRKEDRMNTITAAAIAWEAKTAADEIRVRVHEGDARELDGDDLRGAFPLRTEKMTRREFARLVETCSGDEVDALGAMATEWAWPTASEPCSRYELVEFFGPYQVGRRTEYEALVRELTEDEMDEARAAAAADLTAADVFGY